MIIAKVVIFVLELVIAVFYLRKYHDGSWEYKLEILN